MNIPSVVTSLENLYIQRRLFELILRWFYNNEIEETTSPNLPNLVQVLQGIGFQLYSVRKRKRTSQDDEEKEKSDLRVIIECDSSELTAFLEIQNADCQCPELNNDHVVPVMTPTCFKYSGDTKDTETEPDYSHLLVSVPDEVKKIINPIIRSLLVVLEEAFNNNRSNIQQFINLAEERSNFNAGLPDNDSQTSEGKKNIKSASRETLDLEACLRRNLRKMTIKSTKGVPFLGDPAYSLLEDSASSAVHRANTGSAISKKQQKVGNEDQTLVSIFRKHSVPEDGEDPEIRLSPTNNNDAKLAESLIRMQHDTTRALKILLYNLASQRHCACYPAGCTNVNATSTYAVAGASTSQEQQRPLISDSAFAFIPKPELYESSSGTRRGSSKMNKETDIHRPLPCGSAGFTIPRGNISPIPISLGWLTPPPQLFTVSSPESSASTSMHEVQPSSENITIASLHSFLESLNKGSRPTNERPLQDFRCNFAQSQRTASVLPTLSKTAAKLEKMVSSTESSSESSESSFSKSGSRKM